MLEPSTDLRSLTDDQLEQLWWTRADAEDPYGCYEIVDEQRRRRGTRWEWRTRIGLAIACVVMLVAYYVYLRYTGGSDASATGLGLHQNP